MQTERLAVTGMTCGGCTSKVARALEAVAGVMDVSVSLTEGAVVRFDEQATSIDQLVSAIERAGYGVGNTRAAEAQQRKGCCCG